MKYICNVCGYIYNDEIGDPAYEVEAILWENLSDDWECPLCSMPKEVFTIYDEKISYDF